MEGDDPQEDPNVPGSFQHQNDIVEYTVRRPHVWVAQKFQEINAKYPTAFHNRVVWIPTFRDDS